jgi:hypothetical protein
MLVPWSAIEHLEDVQAWAVLQGVLPQEPDMLPVVGLVEPGVAVGWLYQTDAKVGLLEQFVTNPQACAKARHRAVTEIGLGLVAKAKELGLRRVVTMTPQRSIGRMSIRNGFAYEGPMHVLSREIAP